MIIERFAPSPTGYLHIGHAYSALKAFNCAKTSNGHFLLRIEDIDIQRCKDEYVDAIYEDLHWLGISWQPDVMFQSTRQKAYSNAIQYLINFGLCYPCTCTRKDIQSALSAPQEGSENNFQIYPNTCRSNNFNDTSPNFSIRLNIQKSIEYLNANSAKLSYYEQTSTELIQTHIDVNHLLTQVGDVILARKDIGTSYHIAVVVDDAHQKITHVTRGADIKPETPIHCVLQALLGYETPIYRHHKLIRDETGKRLAKRSDSKAIRKFRSEGFSPQDIIKMVE